MKKFLIMAITAAMLTAAISGCSQNGGEAETTTTVAEEATTVEDGEATDETTAGEEENTDSKVQTILPATKEAYAENYLPNMPLEAETLTMMLTITSDQYVDFVAEVPMISAQVDTVIILQASEGQGDALEAALNTYRDSKVNDTMQYPVNVAKVNASKVVRNGDYVAFLMVGAQNEDMEASEADAADFAEAEVKKAVDAFNGSF